MNKRGNIQFLHNSAIDIVRWDQVVNSSPNARSYAMSWYLDILHPDWHGLVYDNYRYVMPVVFLSKWGIRYAYQPVYAQQHGIFPPATPDITRLIVEELKSHFRYFEIAFNHYNLLPDFDWTLTVRNNLILSLNDDYHRIKSGYSQHTQRYVKSAAKKVSSITPISISEYLGLKKEYAGSHFNQWLPCLKQIMAHALARHEGSVLGAYSPQNQLCGAAFFLKEKGRFTYLDSILSPEGKNIRAMYALIDNFIQNHSEMPMLLDFEGSDQKGIARFFAGFGAQPEPYIKVKYNHLPRLIKWLKR